MEVTRHMQRQSKSKRPTTCTTVQVAWGRCCGEPLSLCMPEHLWWPPSDAAAMNSSIRCCPTVLAQECDFSLYAPKCTQCALSPSNVLSIHYSALTLHLATSQVKTTEGAHQRKMLLTWRWDKVKSCQWVQTCSDGLRTLKWIHCEMLKQKFQSGDPEKEGTCPVFLVLDI
jgi:hypothetical protein